MNEEQQAIKEFAEQHGVDPSAVNMLAQHVMDTMGEAMADESDEYMQVEMMRAGVESYNREMWRMASKFSKNAEFRSIVYGVLSNREAHHVAQ